MDQGYRRNVRDWVFVSIGFQCKMKEAASEQPAGLSKLVKYNILLLLGLERFEPRRLVGTGKLPEVYLDLPTTSSFCPRSTIKQYAEGI
jgi:hypothetical protein